VSSKWRAYFELLRFPAVFTAVADVMMGYLVTHGDLEPLPVFLLLATVSSCLYLAGMVLNDAYDADVDNIERPERPIPSGRVQLSTAFFLGWVLMFAGLASAGAIVLLLHAGPLCIAGLLAYCVYLYDRLGKRTIGPIMIGFCRALNVLLGMSAVGTDTGAALSFFRTPAQLAIVAGIWAYIALVAWIARQEVQFAIARSAVRHMLRGIIVIDAVIVLAFVGPAWALAVLALLVPMLALERWASTT
jgi:4-hydroxybenzoate polyprenyltransferase